MAPKLADPNTFLSNLVSRKGKSDRYGVYLTGVNILANATEDYGYAVDREYTRRDVERIYARDESAWDRLRVETRRNTEGVVFPISFLRGADPNTVFFAVEGNEMSAMVFIPTLLVEEFVTEVTFYQELLRDIALFAGKTPTTIRFTLGFVSVEWDDLVARGHAQEVDIGL